MVLEMKLVLTVSFDRSFGQMINNGSPAKFTGEQRRGLRSFSVARNREGTV